MKRTKRLLAGLSIGAGWTVVAIAQTAAVGTAPSAAVVAPDPKAWQAPDIEKLAQLAVLPGPDHMKVTARTEWLVPTISAFLDASAAK